MLADFSQADRLLAERAYDVCICGTGPAGITVARRLAASKKRVLLLEGGGMEYNDRSQSLYKGANVGLSYWDIELGRLRFFGGTSNHWSGRCGVFSPVDFEQREYFGLTGWPISRDEVLSFLADAQDILDIGGHDLQSTQLLEAGSAFEISQYALSKPTRFAEKYRAEIEEARYIDCFVNANLSNIRLNEDRSRVEAVTVVSESGVARDIKTKQLVLALGAIENARFLLVSGLGRQNDMIGRCFMEHLNVPVGRFVVTDPTFWSQDLAIAPTASLMQREQIGNGILRFERSAQPQSYGRLRVLRQFLRETACSLPKMAELVRAVRDFDCPGDGLVSTLIEQAPNKQSRITLTENVDRLGVNTIQLDWKLDDRDYRTIRELAIASAKELATTNKARVQFSAGILDSRVPLEIGSHAHQMGTTRMASSSANGVVDADCKFHGINNLFVAGSSVFPTGGGTNPTLTVVMLALRLGQHLSDL